MRNRYAPSYRYADVLTLLEAIVLQWKQYHSRGDWPNRNCVKVATHGGSKAYQYDFSSVKIFWINCWKNVDSLIYFEGVCRRFDPTTGNLLKQHLPKQDLYGQPTGKIYIRNESGWTI